MQVSSHRTTFEVSVVIVSFNTRALILQCIKSVYCETPDMLIEVIVVDNGSTDGSVAAIKDEYHDVRLVNLKKNIGFAAASNYGAKIATGRYVLLLNPDTIVLDRAIERVVGFARRHPEYGVYGCRTLHGDGSENLTSGWFKPTLWSVFCSTVALSYLFRNSRLFNPEFVGSVLGKSIKRVDTVTGCFLLMKTGDWRYLGGLDERFFMYGEDADLCQRARNHGMQPVLIGGAAIVHFGGASDRIRSEKLAKLYSARLTLYALHWRPEGTRIAIILMRLHVIVRLIAYSAGALVDRQAVRTRKEWLSLWRARASWSNIDRTISLSTLSLGKWYSQRRVSASHE